MEGPPRLEGIVRSVTYVFLGPEGRNRGNGF